jgi:hypothetical protein
MSWRRPPMSRLAGGAARLITLMRGERAWASQVWSSVGQSFQNPSKRVPTAASDGSRARATGSAPSGRSRGWGHDARVEDAPLRGSPANVATLTDAPQR